MIDAVIFDMDGLLIDSEPLWHEAEIAGFRGVGLSYEQSDCLETTGLRIDEVVAQRFAERPWTGAPLAAVTQAIVDHVVGLVAARGEEKPGATQAIEFVRARGVRLGLASSSPPALIDATLARLGLTAAFEVVASAQAEPLGKPHPGVYLSACARLGVDPRRALAIEDSVNGLVAAKAARLRCLVVPDGGSAADPRFALADLVLGSLADLDAAAWARLTAPSSRLVNSPAR